MGGAAVLLAVVLAVALLGGGEEDDTPSAGHDPAPQTFVLDADRGGAIMRTERGILGVSASGDVKWRLPIGARDMLEFAVCRSRCPRAEVTFARSSAAETPDAPDGPRLRLAPPSWRPVAAVPRLRADRPLLPGPVPLRVTIARAGAQPRLELAAGRSVKTTVKANPLATLSANRRVGLLFGPGEGPGQRAIVLRRRSGGWAVGSARRLGSTELGACISPDGSRIGLLGKGGPRIADVVGGRLGRPRPLAGLRREEIDAGACAVGGDTVATAVLSAGDRRREGTVVRVHSGRRVRTLRLAGRPFYNLWVSSRTGTTAVRIRDRVLLIAPSGKVETLRAQVAALSGPGRLWLMARDRRAYTRPF